MKTVLPAAGIGKRLFPTTKTIPKELLPIYSRVSNNTTFLIPTIQVIFEQLYQNKISNFCFVTRQGEKSIKEHFTQNYQYQNHLNVEQKKLHANFFRRIRNSDIRWICQKKPIGFGNAVKLAEKYVGGLDEKTSNIIQKIYSFVFGVELIIMPNCKTANAVKLTTNVFRDINIAFINELSIMFEKLGIDTMKVLEAAKKKYNFQIHYPGAGVGGPCLPINSYQLLNTAKRTGVTLNIIESGRRINEKMPEHVIELTLDAFKECNKPIQNSDILILGISYKPNVKDIQLTPAEHIIKKLQNHGANVHIFDPYFSSSKVYGINVEKNLDDIISKVDASILVTGHEEFKKIAPSVFNQMKNPILIDTQGIIDPADAKQAKLIFRGLGRGKL